jgi:lipopolysaccharide biosynthesis glycosyltransferase
VLDGLPFKKRLSLSAYLRLLVPELLPSRCDRAIYLDSDLLFQADLACRRQADMGPNEYFNSGLMLMNLSLMRKDEIGQKAITFCKT